MGEFVRVYGYMSKLPNEQIESDAKQLVVADACNQGYTPDGEPILTWNTKSRYVTATLPVVEGTQDGH